MGVVFKLKSSYKIVTFKLRYLSCIFTIKYKYMQNSKNNIYLVLLRLIFTINKNFYISLFFINNLYINHYLNYQLKLQIIYYFEKEKPWAIRISFKKRKVKIHTSLLRVFFIFKIVQTRIHNNICSLLLPSLVISHFLSEREEGTYLFTGKSFE